MDDRAVEGWTGLNGGGLGGGGLGGGELSGGGFGSKLFAVGMRDAGLVVGGGL